MSNALRLLARPNDERELALAGDRVVGSDIPSLDAALRPIAEIAPIKRLVVTAGELGRWDTHC